jgi:Na+/proline symporter
MMICLNSKKIEKTCWPFKELVIAYSTMQLCAFQTLTSTTSNNIITIVAPPTYTCSLNLLFCLAFGFIHLAMRDHLQKLL